MCGLFLLGMLSRKIQNPAAIAAVVCGVLVILWLTIPQFIGSESVVHKNLIPVFGMITIILVGFAVGAMWKRKT